MTVWLFLWILLLLDAAVEIGWTVWDEWERRQPEESSTLVRKKDFTSAVNCGMGKE